MRTSRLLGTPHLRLQRYPGQQPPHRIARADCCCAISCIRWPYNWSKFDRLQREWRKPPVGNQFRDSPSCIGKQGTGTHGVHHRVSRLLIEAAHHENSRLSHFGQVGGLFIYRGGNGNGQHHLMQVFTEGRPRAGPNSSLHPPGLLPGISGGRSDTRKIRLSRIASGSETAPQQRLPASLPDLALLTCLNHSF